MLSWPEPDLQPINLWSLPMYLNDDAYDTRLQPYEQDMAWLKVTRPISTEEELEAFADKCAMVAVDNPNYTDEEIRLQTYRAMGYK